MPTDEFKELKQRSLFSKLRRLFSTDVIVRNVGGKKLKVIDTDELAYATDRNTLRDRFNRIRTSAYNQYSRDFTLSYQAARIELFRDYDTMDMDPIISSALDIYADECVSGETLIPLLDGTKHTIESLFKNNKKNFWVYSVNEKGNFSPQLCERVAYNGKKKMYKITLDDGTIIKCTANHIWVRKNNSQVLTSELTVGDSLKVFSKKLSSSKYMNGYEMLLDGDNRWKYTHRMVANEVSDLVEQKTKIISESKVVHHSSFNKLNNSPDCLQWMDAIDHKKIHAQFNKTIWSDSNKTHEYKTKITEAHKKYWTQEKKQAVSKRQKAFMKSHVGQMTPEDRIRIYGNKKEKNGMFNKGYKLKGEKNGKWKGFTNPSDVDQHAYEFDVAAGNSAKQLSIKYNLNRDGVNKLNNAICKKHGIYRIYQLKQKLEFDVKYKDISIPAIKFFAESELKSGKNIYRNLSSISKHFNITNNELFRFIQLKGYNGIKDLMTSNNHRIVSIEKLDGEYDAYDLVNVGNSTHLYGIECNDGSKLITHNCLTQNELGDILTIRSTNDNIKQILHNLFYDILNIEFNLWSWTRNLVKYGDFYLKMYVSPEFGVYMVEPLSSYNVTRVENSDLNNKNYIKFQCNLPEGGKIEELENYQVAHFRLLSDSNFLPYGKGIIEGARRVWKQVSLMEDAMLIHRIMRAPEKRIYKVDIGNIPPNEVDQYMEKLINKTKKVPYIDEKTGDYNLRFNLWNMVEDIYLPVRGSDSGTSIEPLSGMEFTGIDDIEYLRNKMMAALKIPKAFLGYEEDLSGKATLAAEDVRFARTVQRVQKFIVSELTKIAIVHLYSQGYRDAELVDFSLELTNPSTIFEKEKVSVWQEKVNVAKDMMEAKIYSKKWIYTNVFNTSDDDITVISNDIVEDAKQAYRLKKIEEEGIDPAKPYNKINAGEEGAGAGGGETPPETPAEKPTEPPAAGAAETPPLKERDQTGRKKAREYAFGEDPLGDGENRRRPNKTTTKHPISHAYKNNSPLSFEGLDSHLRADAKKSILNENLEAPKKSFLDESNIIE